MVTGHVNYYVANLPFLAVTVTRQAYHSCTTCMQFTVINGGIFTIYIHNHFKKQWVFDSDGQSSLGINLPSEMRTVASRPYQLQLAS